MPTLGGASKKSVMVNTGVGSLHELNKWFEEDRVDVNAPKKGGS